MISNRYITKVIAAIMALAVCLCMVAVYYSSAIAEAAGGTGVTMEYESELFDTSQILDINIVMDEDDWNTMLENALSEEYYECSIEINGKTFNNVGIRPKGNTSLSSIASDDTTDRYSFKVEFDHYVEGQTCYGLDKLILNNNYADATNMKEALIYDMFQYMGADASLYNYAKISVNGEYWGVYLALEGVEDSFLTRNYGVEDGNLYKPEGMNMGGGQGDHDGGTGGDGDFEPPEDGDFEMPGGGFPGGDDNFQKPGEVSGSSDSEEESSDESSGDLPEPDDDSEMPDFGDMDFGFGSGGANLNYSDDDLDSYDTIWDGEVTKTTKKDHKRVVAALKNISEGTDLEDSMDIDNLLRYMAVHIFSVNEDSLSGSMAHNYYLYEYEGKLNIIPWDYNLALGGMNGGDADSVVNSPIDDAFSSTNFFDTLMENETYKEQYHSYLQQLVDEYINGGGFDAFYERVRSQIDELVETDPTAFYSYDEYVTAAETLYQTVKLRGESISGQLDGTIPSTEDGQRSAQDSLIDASSINLSDMGTMNHGEDQGHGGPGSDEQGHGGPGGDDEHGGHGGAQNRFADDGHGGPGGEQNGSGDEESSDSSEEDQAGESRKDNRDNGKGSGEDHHGGPEDRTEGSAADSEKNPSE